ncbi:hypothetical protein DPMN_120040 [Dreissena polymorpha]|uniref:Uncharacterized protein n=1 Tax=Dreissena polymorpha TaxID=45954 RepID=A0A9D4GJN1_DREPO|nr:hypothetical protein DPMN_120040 [Dreissena polymorpha]
MSWGARYNNVGIGTEGVLSKRLDISIKVCTAAKIVQLSSKERSGFPKSNTLVEGRQKCDTQFKRRTRMVEYNGQCKNSG